MKLSFSKPKVSIGENKDGQQVVVVAYKCTIISKKATKNFTVTGKAIQSVNDKENVRLGRILADSRAKYNAYKHVCHMADYKNLCNQFKEMLEIYNFAEKMYYLKKNESKHIDWILNNEDSN